MSDYRILVGDCREMLRTLPERSVHCVVTSPPYYLLRDYQTATWEGGDPECDHRESKPSRTAASVASSTLGGSKAMVHGSHVYRGDCGRCGARRIDRQIGLESRPDCLAWARGEPPCAECYVCTLRVVFREVWRVLRDDGVLWLNLGDTYAGSWGAQGRNGQLADRSVISARQIAAAPRKLSRTGSIPADSGLKPKDLIGIPWRVAFALQADGWTLRSDVVWAKGASFGPFNGSVMPESVQDRPTKAHEFLFMFTKRARYFYDAEAVREDAVHAGRVVSYDGSQKNTDHENRTYPGAKPRDIEVASGRNLRSVWTISPQPFPGSHFAVMPAALVEPCILAGTSERGCCPECGAPWERVVERERKEPSQRERSGKALTSPRNDGNRWNDNNGRGFVPNTATITGWRPGCDCNAGDPVPCTVLDPFAGSGTVGMVATGRGRRAILIDLNPKYADMMRDRCGPLLEAPTPEVA